MRWLGGLSARLLLLTLLVVVLANAIIVPVLLANRQREWLSDRIAAGRLTLFMAVPTVYAKLIAAWECTVAERGANLSHACGKLRLMVSGVTKMSVGLGW